MKNVFENFFNRNQPDQPDESSSFMHISEVSDTLVKKTSGDRVIWGIVLLLTLASLLLIYSSTGSLAYRLSVSNESYLFKQMGLIVLGMVVIYGAHRINYTIYARIAKILFLISIPLLIYTLFFGVQLNAGSRWIKLPVINMTFQTSDLARLALFMYLSLTLSRKQEVIKDFKKGFLPVILPVLGVCLLIAPANLSTAILIFGTSLLLMFIGRVAVRHLLMVIGIALIPIVLLITVAVTTYNPEPSSSVTTTVTEQTSGSSKRITGRFSTWVGRIQTFIYGKNTDETDKMYQINQAKIAISNGGLIGRGPGRSIQRNFLPHCYSDFIFAIIIEEYGMVGAGLMLFIYLLFLYRCIVLYRKCPFAFGAFLAVALSFTLVIQAFTNMAVNVNLFPNTGVTLPLVSMGGSSFLFTCFSIGIILSVSRNVEQQEGAGNKETLESLTSETSKTA
jgi:cell division protein FtsW